MHPKYQHLRVPWHPAPPLPYPLSNYQHPRHPHLVLQQKRQLRTLRFRFLHSHPCLLQRKVDFYSPRLHLVVTDWRAIRLALLRPLQLPHLLLRKNPVRLLQCIREGRTTLHFGHHPPRGDRLCWSASDRDLCRLLQPRLSDILLRALPK